MGHSVFSHSWNKREFLQKLSFMATPIELHPNVESRVFGPILDHGLKGGTPKAMAPPSTFELGSLFEKVFLLFLKNIVFLFIIYGPKWLFVTFSVGSWTVRNNSRLS